MTVVETILVFVAAPLAVIAILAVLTLRPEKGQKRLRYKPGQPWEHPPVWYEPHPERTGGDAHGPAGGAGPASVPGSGGALGSSMYPEQPDERALDSDHGAGVGVRAESAHGTAVATRGATHGAAVATQGATAASAQGHTQGATAASAQGHTQGATAASAQGATQGATAVATAPRPHPGGPLGGARGTW